MWKLETTAKGKFVYVSLLQQQGSSDLEFISVRFSDVAVGYIRYQHKLSLKSYDLKIVSFCFLLVGSSFYIKTFQYEKKKKHSGLCLSLAITCIDIKDIIRYPSSSLKYHLTSILTVF